MKLTATHSTYELTFAPDEVAALPEVIKATFEGDRQQVQAQLETENITLRIERNAAMERIAQLEADPRDQEAPGR